MTKITNPFITTGYVSPEYFCDREGETQMLRNHIDNGNNVTLFSRRRIGKTGLIKHLFYQLEAKKYLPIYADVYYASNVEGFTDILTSAISVALEQFNSKSKIKTITDALASLRPKLSIDPLTYLPSIEVGVENTAGAKQTISSLLEIVQKTDRQIVIAIDEFQQIRTFESKDFEAAIRSIVQAYPAIRFIFLGSQKHLLFNMFNDRSRPFYRSTSMMQLDKLGRDVYTTFVRHHLKSNRKSITDEAITYILDVAEQQTYYTQLWLNHLFYNAPNTIEVEDVKAALHSLLQQEEQQYYQLRKILPNQQWKVLIAIALAGKVDAPTGKKFLNQYNLGAASSTRQALKKLETMGLVQSDYPSADEKLVYEIDDAFLKQWIQWKYG